MVLDFRNVYDDEERATAYARLGFPGTYYLAFRDLPALFERHVRGRRALDFGCGAGRSTRFLHEHGFDAVGVDISAPMVKEAKRLDPEGDYRLIEPGRLGDLRSGAFDLVFSAFTFDNIETLQERGSTLAALSRLLAPEGRFVSVVSSPEIYINEWASFSTRDFPENRNARSGEKVLIVILDGGDARPVEDTVCHDEDYRRLYDEAGLSVLETLRPLATGNESIEWVSETKIAPWVVYVLGNAPGTSLPCS